MPSSLLLTATSALRLVAALAIRFVEQSTKLFDEGVGHLQIGKAPAIIKLTFLQNCTSMSRLNVSCLVKLNDQAAQCDMEARRCKDTFLRSPPPNSYRHREACLTPSERFPLQGLSTFARFLSPNKSAKR